MSVKLYNYVGAPEQLKCFVKYSKGCFVKYSDYDSLRAQLEKVEAEAYQRGAREMQERAVEIVGDEPCMPGDPDEGMVSVMLAHGPIDTARAACRATKRSIAEKIRALPDTLPTGPSESTKV
jgi:hypothetical protein